MSSVDTAVRFLTKEGRSQSVCNTELATAPWAFDLPSLSTPSYGPGSSQEDTAPPSTPLQGEIPEQYRRAPMAELEDRIATAKRTLGERLVVLSHFYQRDEVVQFADFVGDSFQLAQQAKTRPNADFLVFCGVHFMAETADLLSRPDQAVVLPNLAAGCSMADMADIESVTACWEQLAELGNRATGQPELGLAPDANGRVPIIPVTYMNSSAALKAFCGEHGGIVCTSSNAKAVLAWAFERGQRVLFFPDQHLGRNTAKAMGIPLEHMPLWDPRKPLGGNTQAALHQAQVVLWRGWCSVHKRFTVDQIAKARAEYRGVRVIVHPECPMDVVDAADDYGSTNFILQAVQDATPGSTFAIGTEVNMVRRLAAAHPEHTIFCLDPVICPCSTMYRIHPAYLCWVTEALVQGKVLNQIQVPQNVAGPARLALERMLAVQP